MDFYEVAQIDVKTCVRQCYDGAAYMQSQKQDAASFILKKSPKAYLVLSKSTKLPIIDNAPCHSHEHDVLFQIFSKKERLVEHVASKSTAQESITRVLIGRCKTRWSERYAVNEHFYLALPFCCWITRNYFKHSCRHLQIWSYIPGVKKSLEYCINCIKSR